MKHMAGIRARDLPRLVEAASTRRGGNLDLAMVCVARDGMLRSGEISIVVWGDLQCRADGTALLTIPGDAGAHEHRPLEASTMGFLAELLPESSDPKPHDRIFPLSAGQANRRIGALCRAAGLHGEFGASSPRVGQAEDLAEAGWNVEELSVHGRWRSLEAAWGYVRRSRGYKRIRAMRSRETTKEKNNKFH